MTRAHWIARLKAIVARVEAGEAPARVREIYVFGSFARGAIEPNDLDLIVIHDPPGRDVLAPLLEAVQSYSYDGLDQEFKAYRRFQAQLRKVFRRGGERMDVILGPSLEEAVEGMVMLLREEVRLIWAEGDRDWEGKVAAIVPDATAGRHPRHHFMEVKRTAGTLEDTERVTQMIDEGVLSLRRVRLDGIEEELNPEFQHWLDHWTRVRAMGSDALKVLPWALRWVQEQGGKRPRIWDQNEVGDEKRRCLVQLVRIYPLYVYRCFKSEPGLSLHSLLPRRRVREANWLYVFERGPAWSLAEE